MELFKIFLNLVIQKLVTTVGGFWGWILEKVLKYGGQFLIDWFSDFFRKKKRDQEQKQALEELKKVDADPTKTVDDIGKEYEKFANSGHN